MRLACAGLLLALLAAGCAIPPEEGKDPLFGFCPAWTPGGGRHDARLDIPAGQVSRLKLEAPLTEGAFLLDLFRAKLGNLTQPATVVVRAYADEQGNRSPTAQLGIRSFREQTPSFVPLLPFSSAEDTQREFEVLLSPVAGGDPRPGPLWLTFTNEGSSAAGLDLAVTFHYRVCGA